jgi:hypothetical protein
LATIGELGKIMNFNDHKVIWNTGINPMKDRDYSALSSADALIGVYMSENEPQTLKR